jgi:hypothetical protein
MDRIRISTFPKMNSVFCCEGCSKAKDWTATGWKCSAYAFPQKIYSIRVFGCCPMNQKYAQSNKRKARVGQQKQSKRW